MRACSRPWSREKLNEEAEAIRAEGWKWVEVATDFPYGHTYGMRRIVGEAEPMSDEEAASYQALKAEYEKLEEEHADADELPDEVDARLGEIEAAMEALQERPIRFEDEDRAIAGVFVSIDGSGRLRVERGYVRPEDEPVEATEESSGGDAFDPVSDEAESVDVCRPRSDAAGADEEEDDGLKPLSDRLVSELTAHRTLALRDALANDPQVAFLAALHAMVLQALLPLRARQLRRDRSRGAPRSAATPPASARPPMRSRSTGAPRAGQRRCPRPRRTSGTRSPSSTATAATRSSPTAWP